MSFRSFDKRRQFSRCPAGQHPRLRVDLDADPVARLFSSILSDLLPSLSPSPRLFYCRILDPALPWLVRSDVLRSGLLQRRDNSFGPPTLRIHAEIQDIDQILQGHFLKRVPNGRRGEIPQAQETSPSERHSNLQVRTPLSLRRSAESSGWLDRVPVYTT